MLFGNDGCFGGWQELIRINLIESGGRYPACVWDHPKMIRMGYCESTEKAFSCVKFTDKFIKEIGE